MTELETISAYQSLGRDGQIHLLAQLAHHLTICARDTYVVGTEDVADPPRLRAFNEFQHRLVAQLRHLLDDDRQRYPDDHFAKVLWTGVHDLRCERAFITALQESGKTQRLKQSA